MLALADERCWSLVVGFRHKGLERRYHDGSKQGVQAAHVPKLLRILSALDVAQTADDLAILRQDVLADLGLGVGEAASRLGISRVALNGLRGRRRFAASTKSPDKRTVVPPTARSPFPVDPQPACLCVDREQALRRRRRLGARVV